MAVRNGGRHSFSPAGLASFAPFSISSNGIKGGVSPSMRQGDDVDILGLAAGLSWKAHGNPASFLVPSPSPRPFQYDPNLTARRLRLPNPLLISSFTHSGF